MADAKEHILPGKLGKALTGAKLDLQMEEVSRKVLRDKAPNTHIEG